MKMNAYIAGVGMTKFGKHLDKTLKGLAVKPSRRRWPMPASTSRRFRRPGWAMPRRAWSPARK